MTNLKSWGAADRPVKNKNILFLCDYVAHTGYGTVTKNIIPRIKAILGPAWHIDICAINYLGDMYKEEDGTVVFSAIKNLPADVQLKLSQMQTGNDSADSKQRRLDDFGRIGFLKVLQDSAEPHPDDLPGESGYDGIFILQDLGVVTPMHVAIIEVKKKMKEKNWKNFKSIFYFPVDCRMIDEIVKGVEVFDGIVTYNEYGRQELLRLRSNLKGKIKTIPHGCDTGKFYPLPADEANAFRQEYFGKNAGKFIIINLNRNQHRKDIPATIFGFMEYKKKNPNAFLYLHMHARDPMGWDIRALMWQAELVEGEDYMLPSDDDQNKGVPVEKINKIYNACDVYLTTTRGEGWGLGVTEAMACKLPVICPENSSFFEITNNGARAWLLYNQFPIASRADNIIRMQTDPDEVAERLEEVREEQKQNTDLYKKRIEAAYRYVQSLQWDGIAQQWADLFKEIY